MTDKKLKPIIEYYDNGKIERAYSVDENGNEQGPYESYHENGQLSVKCTYKDGKYDGPYEEYYSNGQLEEKGVYRMGERLYGKEAEEYLKEWNEKHNSKEARKGLNARLAQMNKQMAPTQLRQAVKRAKVAKFRKSQPDKHAGRVIEKKNWLQKLFRGGR